MARSFRGSFRGSPIRTARRSTAWDLGPGGDTTTQRTTTGAAIMGSGVTALVDGLTLVRTRGEFLAYIQVASAFLNGFSGAFGIGITTAAAFAIGVTAVETPLTDEAWDGWLYHRYFTCYANDTVATSVAAETANMVAPTISSVRIEVDSKAMRKVHDETVLYAAVEATLVGTATMQLFFNSRMLFKLT